MQINVNFDQPTNTLPTGFVTAVNWAVDYLDSLFTNPVTLTINVGYGEVAGGSLGGALGGSVGLANTVSYTSVQSALLAQNAPGASTLPSSSPFSGSLYIPQAEAKALGLAAGTTLDGYVGFSNSVSWSFTPNVTPPPGAYDFIGVFEHEITEVMGRISLIDYQPSYYALADLYRYTASGDRSLTTGGAGSLAYFSVDGGQTLLRSWNNDSSNGDLGDWYGSGAPGADMGNDYGLPGVIMPFSAVDLLEMQALGWTTATGPAAPTIASFTPDTGVANDGITSSTALTLSGTAVANSTVNVYDGATLLGTATANASGAWTYTTGTLNSGAHSFTATDTVSGSTSAASAAYNITIDTTAPIAPSISSFSTDSGIAGDSITNDNTLTLTGTAEANSVVQVYEGATLLGSVTANGSGAWSYTTATLTNGAHSLTATATDAAGNVSAATALNVTIDTVAPNAPVVTGNTIVNSNQVQLTGAAEAGSTVKLLEGTAVLGTATANAGGAWSFTTGALPGGAHVFTATASDVAGNTSAASSSVMQLIGATVIESNGSTDLMQAGANFYLCTTGAGPSLKYNGAVYVAGQFGGGWAPISAEKTASGYQVAWKASGADQFNVWTTDNNGNYVSGTGIVAGSNAAVISAETVLRQDLNGDGVIGSVGTGSMSGTGGNDTIVSTSANEIFYGNGGNNTFVFVGNFGKDVIADFNPVANVIELNHSAFASAADVLAHATQVEADVVLTADTTNSITLSHTTLAQLNSHNFHIV